MEAGVAAGAGAEQGMQEGGESDCIPPIRFLSQKKKKKKKNSEEEVGDEFL